MSDDQPEESVEQKKERMRQFMAADRKLEKEKDKRERRRRGGCLFGLLRMTAYLAVLAGIAYLIWLWHPWSTEIVETKATEQNAICGAGVEGVQTVEYFTVLGIRMYESGQSTICFE